MNARVLRGSKQEIAERVAQLPGDVREVIVFVDDVADARPGAGEDIFAEMDGFTVRAGSVDYSRDAIYTRMEGE
jgi:hypothetical protein